MLEAKCAMGNLFEVAATQQMRVATQEADIKELQSQYDELVQSLHATELELKKLREVHHEECVRLKQEYVEKVLFLIGEMFKAESQGPTTAGDKENILREKLKFQEEEITRLNISS